ncbi:MAG: helix-turn-helix transcriptional regulator [Firmicutes bacterium]|nr:helix-turn-helix transcriptional regulator [Bacillota bacterium]
MGNKKIISYSEKIKEIRLSLNMNMREFGEKVDISIANISRLEKGYRGKNKMPIIPLIDTLKQICDKAGYCFRTFLEETGYIEPIENP